MKPFHTVYYKIEKDKSREPLVFAHLSDLHGCTYGEHQEELFEAIRLAQPDLVVVSGDMITQKESVNEKTLAFFQILAERYPVFYSNGNHETRLKQYAESYGSLYQDFRAGLGEMGVCCLNNRSVIRTIKGRRLQFLGYEADMSYFGRFSRKRPTLEQLTDCLGIPETGAFHVLLAHNPMYFPVYADWGADLTFAGHLHGGFLRLPFLGGIITPQFQFFPKYDRGFFEKNGHYLCVSAGLGDKTITPRILNPAELVIVTLQ